MADLNWRTDPAIQAAKRACVELKSTAVIIIHIDDRDGAFGVASYGIDGPRCTRTGRLADFVYQAILDGMDSNRAVLAALS